jgi:hypothetical protein
VAVGLGLVLLAIAAVSVWCSDRVESMILPDGSELRLVATARGMSALYFPYGNPLEKLIFRLVPNRWIEGVQAGKLAANSAKGKLVGLAMKRTIAVDGRNGLVMWFERGPLSTNWNSQLMFWTLDEKGAILREGEGGLILVKVSSKNREFFGARLARNARQTNEVRLRVMASSQDRVLHNAGEFLVRIPER